MEQAKNTKKSTKQIRWVCPECNKGVNAPSKPRMNDVRRYCFPCSTKRGTLVMRTAPALVKKREATRAKQTARKQITTARKREAAKVAGFNVQTEATRLWRDINKARVAAGKRQLTMPEIIVHRCDRYGSSGLCYYGEHKITLSLGTDPVDAWETLAHELNHAQGYKGHNRDFYMALRVIVERRWKITLSTYGWDRFGYGIDHDIRSQLRKAGKQPK